MAISAGCFLLSLWNINICENAGSVPERRFLDSYYTLALGGVRGKSLLQHNEQRTPTHGKLKEERYFIFKYLFLGSYGVY